MMLVDWNYEFFIRIKEQDILKSFHITFQKENSIRNLFLKGKILKDNCYFLKFLLEILVVTKEILH